MFLRESFLELEKNVFLVGGFAASDYLFSRVKEGLELRGLYVYRPDTQM
jgi:hypothetical protein